MTERARYRLYMVIVAVVAATVAVWIDDFVEVDSCLDAGGAWNYQYGFCDR
jgi:hypothetical protein